MSEIHVVAMIVPKPGNEARVKEVIHGLTKYVQDNEKDVLRFQAYEHADDSEGQVYVVQETYKDQAAFDAHKSSDFFKNLAKSMGAEDLLARPLDIKHVKPFAGFASR